MGFQEKNASEIYWTLGGFLGGTYLVENTKVEIVLSMYLVFKSSGLTNISYYEHIWLLNSDVIHFFLQVKFLFQNSMKMMVTRMKLCF